MPARLHHERIARTGSDPAQWLVMTHGIYGAGSNWRGIARKINERRPEWGIALVDLRQHGRSEGGEPPHTVAACADDLAALLGELGARALAGHSFGGKVALATRAIVELDQTWMFDASPSARPEALADPDNSVLRVLSLMERLPAHWPSREAFVAAVTAEGHDTALAQWLAMNLVSEPAAGSSRQRATGDMAGERTEKDELGAGTPGTGPPVPGSPRRVPAGDALVNRLDLSAVRALLADYYAVDLWDAAFAPRGALEVVIATKSQTLSTADRDRLDLAPPHVHRHDIAAGHWLHIEAPSQVVELVCRRLP